VNLKGRAVKEANRRKLEVASVFLKLGALGYGGTALWGVFQNELQERRGWLTKERFLEGLALVQSLPGAPLVQMCIFTGYQRAGAWGGLLAGLAFVLPAFAIMLVLAKLHASLGAAPFMRDAFYGLGPVVLALFAVTLYRLGRNAIKDRPSIAIAAAAAALAAWTPLGLAATIALAGCAGVALNYSRARGLLAGLVVALLAGAEQVVAALLAGPSASATVTPHAADFWDVGLFFLKVGAATFGGGISILGFVQEQVVNQAHWITAQEFLDGLALGQMTPGPIIMVAAYVGYKVVGVAGAALATVAIFLPSFVIMLSIMPVVDRVRGLAWVKAGIRGISPAVVGAISISLLRLAPHAAPDAFAAGVLVLTLLALLAWRLPPLPSLLGGCLIGVLVRSRMFGLLPL
jgi:chromate transporter